MLITWAFLLFLLFSNAPRAIHSSSTLVNVSIDDSSSDPLTGARISYGSVGNATSDLGWNVGQECTICLAQPDPSQAFDRTWHDTSTGANGVNKPFATALFTGVAVYVVGIIVSSTPAVNTALNNTMIFFQVDGTDQGSFLYFATLATEVVYSYNVTFFSMEGLSDGPHNITMICGNGIPILSLCLIDRVIYTSTSPLDSSDSSSSFASSSSKPKEVGPPTIVTMTTRPPSTSINVTSAPTSSTWSAQSANSIISLAPSSPSPSTSVPDSDPSARNSRKSVAAATISLTLLAALLVGLFFAWRRRNRRKKSSLHQDVRTRTDIPFATVYSDPIEHVVGIISNSDPNQELPSYTDIAGSTVQQGRFPVSRSSRPKSAEALARSEF
ncbi:hypothetical protein SCHPADRAFT_381645 [Schizopora paradoxa]|uniref:Uncharacterized protein n=1 Tax=Schizopora paradoxa TaxID=27342 RepID=A0A0H2RUE9_9AGAM|nr:hypothetical protein SCHPADRAFT_381645 [Schizopora paradoxa]